MVETNVNRPIEFRNVPVQVPQKEFDVAAEDFIVLLGEVAVRPVRFQVFGAEQSYKPLKLGTKKRNIESGCEQQLRFP